MYSQFREILMQIYHKQRTAVDRCVHELFYKKVLPERLEEFKYLFKDINEQIFNYLSFGTTPSVTFGDSVSASVSVDWEPSPTAYRHAACLEKLLKM